MSLTLYKNNYLRWKLETGAGALNEGATIRNNRLYDEEAQHNRVHNYYAQPIMIGQPVRIQFLTADAGPFQLYVCDENRLVKQALANFVQLAPAGQQWNTLQAVGVEGRLYISKQLDLGLDDEVTSWEAFSEPLAFMDDLVKVTYYHRTDLEDGVYFTKTGEPVQLQHFGYFNNLAIINLEIEEEEETEQDSKGDLVLVSSKASHNYTLQTDQMPAYMHDKLQRILRHSTVLIDGERYVKNGAYELQPGENSSLLTASCRVRHVGTYSEINY